VDLVPLLTTALPMTVIGELAGIPPADRRWILERAPLVTVETPDEASAKASSEVFEYFRTALDARRTAPTDDLLSHLLAAKVPEHKLVQLALRCCLPGFHSVSVALSKGIPILLRQPEIYAETGRRDDLVAPVVEELLRLATPAATSLPRLTIGDVELAGVPIPKGSVVVGSLESANSDERRYPDPECIVPQRGTAEHTTFGRGPNFCFGAALSRMELQVVVAGLARRFPRLRLAVAEDRLPFRTGVIAPDVLALPVEGI
jgi:cytochrome P450